MITVVSGLQRSGQTGEGRGVNTTHITLQHTSSCFYVLIVTWYLLDSEQHMDTKLTQEIWRKTSKVSDNRTGRSLFAGISMTPAPPRPRPGCVWHHHAVLTIIKAESSPISGAGSSSRQHTPPIIVWLNWWLVAINITWILHTTHIYINMNIMEILDTEQNVWLILSCPQILKYIFKQRGMEPFSCWTQYSKLGPLELTG